MFETLRGVETVFLESNHDVYQMKNGEYPYYLKQRILSPQGHLSNDDAAQAVAEWGKYGLQKVILAHLSEHNNRPEWALEETERALRLAGLREQVYRWGGNYSLATARRSVPHPASEDRIDDGRGSHPVRFWSVVVGSLLH